jgi:CelD/BcsL family acetyltransferase involved in cellulose biosynthesis
MRIDYHFLDLLSTQEYCYYRMNAENRKAKDRVLKRIFSKKKRQHFHRISRGNGYSLSVLARTRPQGRRELYRVMKPSLSSHCRRIALRILNQSEVVK